MTARSGTHRSTTRRPAASISTPGWPRSSSLPANNGRRIFLQNTRPARGGFSIWPNKNPRSVTTEDTKAHEAKKRRRQPNLRQTEMQVQFTKTEQDGNLRTFAH